MKTEQTTMSNQYRNKINRLRSKMVKRRVNLDAPPDDLEFCYAVAAGSEADARIAELDAQLAHARKQQAELVELLREAELALKNSYDATEWPADGSSSQEQVGAKINAALAQQDKPAGEWITPTSEKKAND